MPREIEDAHQVIRLLARKCLDLRNRLEEELNHRYGRRSEKRGRRKNKGSDDSPEAAAKPDGTPDGGEDVANSATGEDDTEEEEASGKPGHGRRPIPPDLPRHEILINLDDEKCLRCGGPTHHLERVESYRFDYVPGHIRVVVLVRWREACDDSSCDGPFKMAKLPPEPIPKGRATAAFLAHLLVGKFADHCPLYRFRKILLRQKVDLPLSTLVDYCRKATGLLNPLWELMKQQILLSVIIKTDDTHVRVRRPGKQGALKGHLWAYKGDEEHPYVVFEFTPNWEGKAPQAFLATYKGYIQADAYKGYDELFKSEERIEVGCMAHARRKWVKAEKASQRVAGEALEMIGELYAIEDECSEMTPEARKAVRQERSAPILEKLGEWMEDQKGRVLPKNPVAKAIDYMQNQWEALGRFVNDGRLKIDNNEIERELRSVALGRKNWMAAGSEVGGETAAIGYTMIASAIACGVDPVEWLTDVLNRIVTCPPDRLFELLPDRWKAARGAERSSSAEMKVQESVDTPAAPSPQVGSPESESMQIPEPDSGAEAEELPPEESGDAGDSPVGSIEKQSHHIGQNGHAGNLAGSSTPGLTQCENTDSRSIGGAAEADPKCHPACGPGDAMERGNGGQEMTSVALPGDSLERDSDLANPRECNNKRSRAPP